MALTNAEKQARWRAKRNALVVNQPDVVERALRRRSGPSAVSYRRPNASP
jgi:hypothetical protein